MSKKLLSLADISNEWKQDCSINPQRIEKEIQRTPQLHAKYSRALSIQKQLLQKCRDEQRKMKLIFDLYYDKRLSEEDLKEYELKPLKQIVPPALKKQLIEEDLVKYNNKVFNVNNRIELLVSIIEQINQRSFLLNTLLKARAFHQGMNL